MRAIITALFLILFSQSAGANTYVEDIVKKCTPFSNNGFEITDANSYFCFVYFEAARDIAVTNCESFRMFEENNIPYHEVIKKFKSGQIPSVAIFIQQYLNIAKERPEVWDNPAPLLIDEVLSEWDC